MYSVHVKCRTSFIWSYLTFVINNRYLHLFQCIQGKSIAQVQMICFAMKLAILQASCASCQINVDSSEINLNHFSMHFKPNRGISLTPLERLENVFSKDPDSKRNCSGSMA